MRTTTDAPSEDLRARLWWSLWTEPGDREVGEFIERLGAAEAARVAHRVLRRGHRQVATNVSEDLSLFRRLASARRPPPTHEQVAEALERCEREEIRLTTPQDGEWPSAFDGLGPHQPLVIFIGVSSSACTPPRHLLPLSAPGAPA